MRKKHKIPIIDVKKYGGRQVAIIDNRVIADAQTLGEIVKKVKKIKPETPLSEIKIFSVPKTLSVIYYV